MDVIDTMVDPVEVDDVVATKPVRLKNRIVLSANPSFATPVEILFWDSLDALLAKEGWLLVHCSARKFPGTRQMFRTPGRMLNASWFFAGMALPDGLPGWLSKAEFELIFDWERKRFPLDADRPEMRDGLLRFAWYVDQVFRELEPAACLCSNKMDPAVRLFWLAAPAFGAERVFVERSPFDGKWVEHDGMFGESGIPAAFAARDRSQDEAWREVGEAIVETLRGNAEGFRPQGHDAESTRERLDALPKPLVFLPFDNILWTGWAQPGHPQFFSDHYIHESAEKVLSDLAARVRAAGGSMVVKRHPCCRSVDDSLIPEVTFMDDLDLDTALAAADIVMGFNTKVIFPALAHGKPSIVLSPNPVLASGVCLVGKSLQAVDGLLSEAKDWRWDDDKRRAFETFCGWLENAYFYKVSDGRVRGVRAQFDFADGLLDRIDGRRVRPTLADAEVGLARVGELVRGRSISATGAAGGQAVIFCDVSRLRVRALWNSGVSRCIRDFVPELYAARPGSVVCVSGATKPRDSGEEYTNDEVAERLGLPVIEGAPQVRKELARFREAGQACVYLSTFFPLDKQKFSKDFDARVVIVHDLFHLSEPDYYGGAFRESNVTRILAGLDPARDFVAMVSGFTRQEFHRLVRFPYWRTTVVPNAADALVKVSGDDAALPEAVGSEPFFMVFAQSDPRKNIAGTLDGISEAFRAYGDSAPPARCVIVASAVYLEESKLLLARWIGDASRFVMVVSPTDVELAAMYKHARFLVFTPLMEGFGLPALEAMALGCPVIASFTTSIPEVCGAAAYYVDPEDPSSIASAVTLLLENDSARDQLVAKCGAQASRFSWARSAMSFADWLDRAQELAGDGAPDIGQEGPTTASYGHYGFAPVPDRHVEDLLKLLPARADAGPRKLPESAVEYQRLAEELGEELRLAKKRIHSLVTLPPGANLLPASVVRVIQRVRGFPLRQHLAKIWWQVRTFSVRNAVKKWSNGS